MRGSSCSNGALWRLVMPMRVKCGTTPFGMKRCICGSTIRFEEGMMKPMRARGTIGSYCIVIDLPHDWLADGGSLSVPPPANNNASEV